jgi:hypothetical protein
MEVSLPMAAAVVAMIKAAITLSMSPLKTTIEHFLVSVSFIYVPPVITYFYL